MRQKAIINKLIKKIHLSKQLKTIIKNNKLFNLINKKQNYFLEKF